MSQCKPEGGKTARARRSQNPTYSPTDKERALRYSRSAGLSTLNSTLDGADLRLREPVRNLLEGKRSVLGGRFDRAWNSVAQDRAHGSRHIRRFVEADSMACLSLSGLRQAVSDDRHDYCYACYTGDYPTDLINLDDLMQAKERRG